MSRTIAPTNHQLQSQSAAKLTRLEIAFVSAVVLAGVILRVRLAAITFFNPDETVHAMFAFTTVREIVDYSFDVDKHPPLLMLINHLISMVSRGELAMRLVSIVSGTLFPVLMGIWLRRVAGKVAAMAVLFLLTFTPHFLSLGAQVRSYALALLFLSASMVALECAIATGGLAPMLWFDFFLVVGTFTEFGMAWFAGAAGVYLLLHRRMLPRNVKIAWAAGQIVVLILYGALFIGNGRFIPGSVTAEVVRNSYLSSAFPHRGTMLTFPWTNILKQSEYLMASTTLGAFGTVVFVLSSFLLWTGRTQIAREKARALAILFTVPFALGLIGAYARMYPFGRSRHTVMVGVFVACGIAIFIASLPRRARGALLCAPVVMVAVWLLFPDHDQGNLPADGNRKSDLLECIAYVHAVIPPGTLIFIDRETLQLLIYYEGGPWPLGKPSPVFTDVMLAGRWRAAWRNPRFNTASQYQDALAAFRAQYGIPDAQPVWVVMGGWHALLPPVDPQRPFTRAMSVFQSP